MISNGHGLVVVPETRNIVNVFAPSRTFINIADSDDVAFKTHYKFISQKIKVHFAVRVFLKVAIYFAKAIA